MLRLSASGLTCVRGMRTVFQGLNLQLQGGHALALVGPNGAGKSSLLRLIAGLLRPAAGSIALEGGNLELTVPEQAHYQGHLDAYKPALTVAENLDFWARYLGGSADLRALAAVGLDAIAHLPAAYLSAGQKRRLSLARLIAVPRPLWLLDEPTAALDVAGQARFAEEMQAHLAGGGMIVAATHAPLGIGCTTLQLGQSAPSPHSPSKTGVNALLVGEGWGGGSEVTPTPNPLSLIHI